MQAAESLKKTLEAEAEQARPAEVVEYEGIFGPHTTLRYTSTFGGFKEDIILSQYTGVNTFTFRIKTGGLMLAEDEGSYALVDPLTGEKTASISDLYIYDSREWDAEEEETAEAPEGEPSVEAEEPPLPAYQHHYSVETVIPDQEYLITVVVDEAYLSSEDRVYPVIVDPSFDFNRGSTAINDAVLYSSASARNQKHGSNWDHYIGYYNSTYGVGRLLVKFPGLTNSRVFQSLDKSQITGATFYAWQYRDTSVTTSVRAYLYNGTAWDEQDIRCTTASWNGYASVDGMNGISVTGRAWYGFNIKPAVLKWKDGTHDPAKGLMIRNANESNSSCFKVFNSREWGSSQNSSQMPYVTLSWNAPTPSGISNNGVYYFQNVCSGKYLDIQNNGTANNTPTIQSSLTHNASQRFKLVRDSSGYYRIHAQNTTAKRVLLLNTSNQVVLSDDCSSERALWRIKDEGSGRYSFINKANEGTYAYAMSNMGSGSSGAQIKGESYTNTTRLRWRLRSAVTSISLSESAVWIAYGNTVALTCSINPAGSYNTTVYWTTNDPAVATVSSNGHTATINAVGYGSTVITARTADGNYTANCTVTVIYQYNIHESLFLGQMLDEELMNHQLTFNQARSILQCLQSNNGTISVEQLSAIMGFTCAQSGAHLIELTYATSLYNMSLGDAVFFYNQQLSSDRQTALSYLFFQVLTSISSGIRVTSPEFNPNSRLDMVEKNLLENGVTFKPLHGSLTAYKMPSPHGLIGVAFENYLKENLGGSGSFSVNGREFDGNGYGGKRWYEAKSGQYWEMCMSNNEKLGKFQSTAGDCRKIAEDNGATYEIISNVPIPQSIKEWLQSKNIPFTEMLF